jgi:hypothetical protein
MLTDWIGERGAIIKLSGNYRGINRVNEEIFCYGTVTKKYVENGKNCARVEIWAENPHGERTVTGSAVVSLPSRVQL